MKNSSGKPEAESFASLAERIDAFEKYTHPHARAMCEVAERLAQRLGLPQSDAKAIGDAAMLHDIGLYVMNATYTAQPRPLTFEERMDVWRHPVIGEQQMAQRGTTRQAQLLVRWHQEWWNGTGYPDGLSFEDIPIGARILRAVDLFSALISNRPYRPAFDDEQVIEVLQAAAGVECDPYVIAALLELLDDLHRHFQQQSEGEPGNVPSEAHGNPYLAAAVFSSSDGSLTGDSQPQDPPVSLAEPAVFDPPSLPKPHLPTPEPTGAQPAAAVWRAPEKPPSRFRLDIERLIAQGKEIDLLDAPRWQQWGRSGYNRKALLGFQASVLRQLDFRSIALALSGGTRLDWYLKAWGKVIYSNDPRAWAAQIARAMMESREALGEEQIAQLLQDVYVPGVRLHNRELRGWFSEMDSWWLDNLRRNLEQIEDDGLRAQAIYFGLQTGDYALSFTDATAELKRPLSSVFWRMAGRFTLGAPSHSNNRTFNQSVEEFASHSRADLFYLNLPAAQIERTGSETRFDWRESWVRGGSPHSEDQALKLMLTSQSKHTYLAMFERILCAAAHIRVWAIEYQETGLASAHDITEIIKKHRSVRATYAKDLTEVAGGLRNYIIVADLS